MADDDKGYIVVTETQTGLSQGVRTYTYHKDKETFDRWYKGKMRDGSEQPLRDVYKVVAEGITSEEAHAICSAPAARAAAMRSQYLEMLEILQLNLSGLFSEIAEHVDMESDTKAELFVDAKYDVWTLQAKGLKGRKLARRANRIYRKAKREALAL